MNSVAWIVLSKFKCSDSTNSEKQYFYFHGNPSAPKLLFSDSNLVNYHQQNSFLLSHIFLKQAGISYPWGLLNSKYNLTALPGGTQCIILEMQLWGKGRGSPPTWTPHNPRKVYGISTKTMWFFTMHGENHLSWIEVLSRLYLET